MAKAVAMPQAGISVESCIITNWIKHVGDQVAVGDILFEYETDKASFECESPEEGTLLEVFFAEGDEVPVLVNVCAIGEAGEDVSGLRPAGAEDAPPAVVAEKQSAAPPVIAASGERTLASPRARNLALDKEISLEGKKGSGPGGRVIERDVRAWAEGAEPEPLAAAPAMPSGAPQQEEEYTDIPFTNIRKLIASGMAASLRDIPQLTHHFSFDASSIQAYRTLVKQGAESGGLPNITLGDMILFAVSRLLPKYPDLNAHMLEENAIRRFKPVHLGFACDTERGLMVPVIRNADKKSLAEISREVKDLAKQAQSGSLSPDYMAGGTFTVSNLGSFGVESFTPVINPPQTGILGVDTIVERPRRKGEGIALYPSMGLSLTYDHRAIDGAPASRFAQELCRALESFPLLLAK